MRRISNDISSIGCVNVKYMCDMSNAFRHLHRHSDVVLELKIGVWQYDCQLRVTVSCQLLLHSIQEPQADLQAEVPIASCNCVQSNALWARGKECVEPLFHNVQMSNSACSLANEMLLVSKNDNFLPCCKLSDALLTHSRTYRFATWSYCFRNYCSRSSRLLNVEAHQCV